MDKIAGKYKGTQDLRHVNCGGQLAIEASGTISIPLGFGFRGSKFVIDKGEYKTVRGWCFKCNTKGVFVKEGRGKIVTVKPKNINKKIEHARQGLSAKSAPNKVADDRVADKTLAKMGLA
jgi:hypothetical protein